MRFQATLLVSLAVLAPVAAAAQPAPPSPGAGTDAETGEQGAEAPDAEGTEASSDTEGAEASDAEPGAGEASSNAGTEDAAEQAADNDDDDDDDTPEVGSVPPLVPPAVDTLGGHVSLAGSAGLTLPFGDLSQNASQSKLMGSGWGFGAELGYGISRTVVVGAWGQALRLGSGSACSGCSTSSFAVGPFVRYHLVQGVRFDPWMSAGLGFRSTTVSGVPGGDLSYSGLEWLRLRVGGDWYAFSKLGFGPFFELDAGHYLSRPARTTGNAATHLAFTLGVRVILDLPGK